MNKIKTLFQQALMISTGILFAIAAEGVFRHLAGSDIVLSWYHPLSILLTGFICALPSLLLMDIESLTKKQFIVRLILHCVLLYGIVVLAGYLFRWYGNVFEFVFVTISYFLIYALVWLATGWLGKKDENQINHALMDIQDEE